MTLTTHTPRQGTVEQAARTLVVPGLVAAAVAAVAVTLYAALAMAVGVDFEMPDGGESVPLLAFTQVTFVLSAVGLAGAAALRRWATRPARTFLRLALTLTAISLAPPFLVDANIATTAALVLAHLLAAAVVIPVVVSRLRVR